MHRDAPFFRGPEQMAKRAKAAVVFTGIKKLKGDTITVNFRKFCEDASLTGNHEILNAYVHF